MHSLSSILLFKQVPSILIRVKHISDGQFFGNFRQFMRKITSVKSINAHATQYSDKL
jgi:hypothetical protein